MSHEDTGLAEDASAQQPARGAADPRPRPRGGRAPLPLTKTRPPTARLTCRMSSCKACLQRQGLLSRVLPKLANKMSHGPLAE